MKRKLLLLLATVSFIIFITIPEPHMMDKSLQQQSIQTMGHGPGGG